MISVSVVIPTYRRPKRLLRALESLQRQDATSDRWETIVVGDGGAYWWSSLESQFPVRFLIVERSGAGAARNEGVAHARGEWILFTDDDCVFPESWVANWIRVIDKVHERVAMIGGPIQPLRVRERESGVEWFLSHTKHMNGPLYINERIECIPAANAAVRRAAFIQIGGFDRRLRGAGGEDSDLTYRLSRTNLLGFAPEPVVYHDNNISYADLATKYFRYGIGVGRHILLCGRMPREGLFVADKAAGILRRIPFVATGAIRESRSVSTRTLRGAAICAVCFVLMRISYQLGGAWALASTPIDTTTGRA